jgi:DNA-binding transcriptional ArsR family regulator
MLFFKNIWVKIYISNKFEVISTFIKRIILIYNMPKEKFLLVSLSESKAKELAQAISNETCRKILDYLAEKEATESELAEKLAVPISTVHYNLQQLQKGNLVVVDEFHYSQKGKEINHYKLANKYIIIAPKSTYGIREKLRSILPVAIILALGAGIINFFSKAGFYSANKAIVQEAAPMMMDIAEKTTLAASSGIRENITQPIVQAAQDSIRSSTPNIFLWFLIGVFLALLGYLIVDWIRHRKD